MPTGHGLPDTIGDATLRDVPYIWASSISKLMSGDCQCQWAMWFRAHYKHTKLPSNLEAWQVTHNKLVLRRKDELIGDGFRVYVEAQNHFTLPSKDKKVKIGGRPDIIAVKSNNIVIEECKTGLPKNLDLTQLLLYMHLTPAVLAQCKGGAITGRLVYTEKTIEVPTSRIDDNFKSSFLKTIQIVKSDTPPSRTPSVQECGRCDISGLYCEDRIESANGEVVEHDLF